MFRVVVLGLVCCMWVLFAFRDFFFVVFGWLVEVCCLPVWFGGVEGLLGVDCLGLFIIVLWFG